MSKDRTEADVAFIEALAEILERKALTEITVSREYGKDDALEVHLSKAPPPAAPAPAQMPSPPSTATQTSASAATSETQSSEDEVADPARHPGAVTSPMVGTAYLAAEPGSDPFVSVGSQVSEGQTLLIIEAMKTMNHIPAPRAGTVRRILVEDGTPVEYGAPLMVVE